MKKIILTKKVTIPLLFGLLLLQTGCPPGVRHRRLIQRNLLTLGLRKEAFLAEWGTPDDTRIVSGNDEEILSAKWGSGSLAFFRRGRIAELWEYKKRGVWLLFQRSRLICWRKEKTTQELKYDRHLYH